jgi:hypothetical protein
MNTRKLVLLATALLCASALIVAGCGSSDATTTTSAQGSVTTQSGTETTQAGTEATVGRTTTSTDAGAVGAQANPVPLGQEAQVSDWTVKVVEATVDATETVLAYNEFTDPPQTGNQYVLVTIEATRMAEEAGAFWADTYYVFRGSAGDVFEFAGWVDVPDSMENTDQVEPGATLTATLVFEVPSDQVSGGAVLLGDALSLAPVDVYFAIE